MRPATAISALEASFAQGLIEALTQIATGEDAVLLVGYDGGAYGPLAAVAHSRGLLGAALVLSRPRAGAPTLRVWLDDGTAADAPPPGRLVAHDGDNASAPMLPLFEALASRHDRVALPAGAGRSLWVELSHD
jgi:hypothetical protein